MPVSGVVVKCRPGAEQEVAAAARQLPGVEVHGVLPDGQVVVVIESDTVNGEADCAMALQQLDGVVSVQIAYHHFEDVTIEPCQGGAYGTDEA